MEHFQELISGDKYFEHELNNMKESSILASVDGALSLLYSRQDQLPEVYTDSCMVISLLQQWLTKHLCDKMLQVMKPEALLVHHKALSLPAQKHFLRSYTKQGHFSLKDLINKQLDLLGINQNKGYFCILFVVYCLCICCLLYCLVVYMCLFLLFVCFLLLFANCLFFLAACAPTSSSASLALPHFSIISQHSTQMLTRTLKKQCPDCFQN